MSQTRFCVWTFLVLRRRASLHKVGAILKQVLWTLWQQTLRDPIALYTFILSIFTVGLWYVTWRALKANKESSERQLRAYFHVSQIGNFPQENPRPLCTFELKNVGQTPAYSATIKIKACIRPHPLPENSLPGYESDDINTMGVISPTVDLNISIRPVETLTPDQLARLTTDGGNLALYVFGELAYRDAFHKDRRHKFMLFSEGENAKMGRLVYSSDGNEAN